LFVGNTSQTGHRSGSRDSGVDRSGPGGAAVVRQALVKESSVSAHEHQEAAALELDDRRLFGSGDGLPAAVAFGSLLPLRDLGHIDGYFARLLPGLSPIVAVETVGIDVFHRIPADETGE